MTRYELRFRLNASGCDGIPCTSVRYRPTGTQGAVMEVIWFSGQSYDPGCPGPTVKLKVQPDGRLVMFHEIPVPLGGVGVAPSYVMFAKITFVSP